MLCDIHLHQCISYLSWSWFEVNPLFGSFDLGWRRRCYLWLSLFKGVNRPFVCSSIPYSTVLLVLLVFSHCSQYYFIINTNLNDLFEVASTQVIWKICKLAEKIFWFDSSVSSFHVELSIIVVETTNLCHEIAVYSKKHMHW